MESFIICLHIYSGVPDPQWEVHRDSPNFPAIANLLTNHVNTELPSILGYKGYSVDLIRGGQCIQHYSIGKKKLVDLERLLLETAPEETKQKVGQYVNQALAQN